MKKSKYELGLPHWKKKQRQRFREILEAQERGECKVAYWNSDAYGFPANHDCQDLKWRAEPGKIQEVAGPLELCSSKALHATLEPHKWKGSKVWIVALWGEIKTQNDKFGALKREIVGEVLPHEAINESVGARLGRKDLAGADLSGADLIRANLSLADLSGANLSLADLSRADLSGAKLSGAYLSGAYLFGAYLSGAYLSGAYLSGAYLSGANLTRADLTRAYLYGADLTRANLTGAGLFWANLTEANLTGANLAGANLTGANLAGANLTGANLAGANLSGADLSRAYVGPGVLIPGWKNDNGLLKKGN